MSVTVKSSGPRGAKTYEIRWKNGELYDYTDNATAAKRLAAAARKAEKAYYRKSNPGLVKAVKTLLKKANPAARISGASVVKLKGGGLTIRPIKANAAKRRRK